MMLMCGRWATLTGQPKDKVLVQQAKCLLAEELELIGSVSPEIWEEVSSNFVQQGITPFSAAQFLVRQAREMSQEADCQSGELYHVLKVRILTPSLSLNNETILAAMLSINPFPT